MTSETTEESGVNVCMSALPFGSGRERRRFESEPTDANEPCNIGTTQTGQENGGNSFFNGTQPCPRTIRTPLSRRNHKSGTVKPFLTECGRGASLAIAKLVCVPRTQRSA